MPCLERLALLGTHLIPRTVHVEERLQPKALCNTTDAVQAAATTAAGMAADEPSSVPVRWDEHVERFAPGSAEAADYLTEHGFVVIRQVLSDQECRQALDLLWDGLEELGSGIDRHDVNTWTNDRWPGQGQTGSGLTGVRGDYGFTHCPAAWFVRGVPAVKESFSAMWGTDDLFTSLDGLAVTRPWGIETEWRPTQAFHWDRGFTRPERFEYLQGFVNLLPTTPSTGGNVVLPGLHTKFAELAEEYSDESGNVNLDAPRLLADHPELWTGAHAPINPHLEAGDLYLWDDRCLHCGGAPPTKPDATPKLQRAMILVCMKPKSESEPGASKNRKQAFERGVGGGHVAGRLIDIDGTVTSLKENGRWDNYGKFNRINPPVLDAGQLDLLV